MIALDGSIPAALLIWFQTIASAIPIRARMTVLELVFGCMLTGRGHVTQALSAITPRRGWRAYFRMLETDGFSWLDIVHALCRIVRDSFVPQDQCVIALDDTLLPRSSKKAPGAGRRFDHARKPNRPSHVLAQNLVSLAVVVGPPGRRRSLPLASRLADDSLAGGKLTTAKILIGAVLRRLRPDILLVDAWFMRARLVLWAVARGITVVGQARLDTVLFLRPPSQSGRGRPAKYGTRFDRDKLALLPVVEQRLGVYGNVPIRFRSFVFRARFLKGLEVRAVWVSLRSKGRWTKDRLLLSTDPTMTPEAIIRFYADRWTIEPMFNGLKHAEGAKELWQRSWDAFHRWLHLVQAGMALTIMLSLRDDPDIVRLAHAGGWRCEVHPTAGMIKDGLIRRFRNCRVDGLFARKGRKSGLVLAARPSAAAMAA
jgi:hypothetical protein